MTITELREWMREEELRDEWWVFYSGEVMESNVSIDDLRLRVLARDPSLEVVMVRNIERDDVSTSWIRVELHEGYDFVPYDGPESKKNLGGVSWVMIMGLVVGIVFFGSMALFLLFVN